MTRMWLITILLAAAGVAQLPTGVITGQLRGSDGMPAAGVRIAAAEVQTRSEQRDLVSIGRTDESGRYRLEGIPPGQYWIVAGSLASPTYYPGTAESASARSVTVTAGATVGSVNFSVVAALNAMSIEASGRTGDGRRPKINGRFTVEGTGELPRPFGDFHVWYGGMAPLVAEDGTFTVSLLPNAEFVTVAIYGNRLIGDHYIKSMMYGSLDLLKNPLLVTGTASGIEVILAPGSRISGNVRTQEGAPADLTLYLIPNVPIPGRTDLLRLVNTDAQGRFEIFGVAPGEYRLSSANDTELSREFPIVTVSGDVLDVRLVLGAGRSLRRVQ